MKGISKRYVSGSKRTSKDLEMKAFDWGQFEGNF